MQIKGTAAAEIAGSVRDLVASGELAPRSVLPPVRALAAELGVNRNTVALAYRRLVEAGVAETRGRGGTVIAAVPQLAREGIGVGGDAVDLASGNPDPELLPDILAAARGGHYRPPLYGVPAVDAGLAAWASADFAEDIEQPFRTLVAHGAVDATERLLNAHLARGDTVAIEDPCFLASIGTLRLNGYRSAPVQVDAAGDASRRPAGRTGGRRPCGRLHAPRPQPDRREPHRGTGGQPPRGPCRTPSGPGDRGRPLLSGLRTAVLPNHPSDHRAVGSGAVRVQVPRPGPSPRPRSRRRRDCRAPGGPVEQPAPHG